MELPAVGELYDGLAAGDLAGGPLQCEVHIYGEIRRGATHRDLPGAHEVAHQPAPQNCQSLVVEVRGVVSRHLLHHHLQHIIIIEVTGACKSVDLPAI